MPAHCSGATNALRNFVINNQGHGIYQSVSDASVAISGNTVYGNGLVP